jgi:hypothetical protein
MTVADGTSTGRQLVGNSFPDLFPQRREQSREQLSEIVALYGRNSLGNRWEQVSWFLGTTLFPYREQVVPTRPQHRTTRRSLDHPYSTTTTRSGSPFDNVHDLTERRRPNVPYGQQRQMTNRALRVAEAEMWRLQQFGRGRHKRSDRGDTG